MSLHQVFEEFSSKMIRVYGVAGVGLSCHSKPKIKVYLEVPLKFIKPKKYKGLEVEYVYTGPFRVLSLAKSIVAKRKQRWRPAPGGVSVGHYRITAGTLGCWVYDALTNERLLLSNNHVIALRWGARKIGKKGDPILQPGPYDGGRDPSDRIALLERWYEVDTGKENLIDAAVARPVSSDVISDEVLDIGTPGPTYELKPEDAGRPVKKSGRTTGLTKGVIDSISATVKVSGWGVCIFKDQVVIKGSTGMVRPGDSGSYCCLDYPGNPTVGLVFAGNYWGNYGVVCKATHIRDLLGVKFHPSESVPTRPAIPPEAVAAVGAGILIGALSGFAYASYERKKRVRVA